MVLGFAILNVGFGSDQGRNFVPRQFEQNYFRSMKVIPKLYWILWVRFPDKFVWIAILEH